MNYYAVRLPILDEEKSRVYREDHLKYLEGLVGQGNIFTYGRFTDGTGGLVIYKAKDLEEAAALAKQDPYVSSGARDFVINEWAMNTEVLSR
ncbi:YciI family protein [Fictibacillus sp. KIGAM418]|uniref:YciI family protein n=1 Tax=Fictibacillus marinisediminis TaxID=2878389 RepID=A0A9X2BH42_9BACL|nr:YciI family protein [Fictibacillus marinisediminis]MCK6257188.1 YciI family protein [Fictibacillus marinisediminis]